MLDWLIDLARRSRHRFMVRLVKGAYWDSEIKRAQVDGQAGYPVYTRKVYTDVAYLACARKLLAAQDAIFPQFATHNAYSLAAVHELGRGKDYEFQCLHGMGETLYDEVVGPEKLNRACRVYAPVGTHETLLAYLVRRLLENGANSSFVNRLVDPAVSIDELVADQVEAAARLGGRPYEPIPLPRELYGAVRLNSKGVDLSSELDLRWLQQGLEASTLVEWAACPILGSGERHDAEALPIRNPADRDDVVGTVREADTTDVDVALGIAAGAASGWAATEVATRAGCLERTADAARGGDAGADRARDPRGRQVDPQRRRRGARGGGFLPLLRGADPRRVQERHAPRLGSGRLHRALELSARDFRRRGQRGVGGGQPSAGETSRADAADRRACRPTVPSSGRAGRGAAAVAWAGNRGRGAGR